MSQTNHCHVQALEGIFKISQPDNAQFFNRILSEDQRNSFVKNCAYLKSLWGGSRLHTSLSANIVNETLDVYIEWMTPDTDCDDIDIVVKEFLIGDLIISNGTHGCLDYDLGSIDGGLVEGMIDRIGYLAEDLYDLRKLVERLAVPSPKSTELIHFQYEPKWYMISEEHRDNFVEGYWFLDQASARELIKAELEKIQFRTYEIRQLASKIK